MKLRIASDLHLEFWSDSPNDFATHFLPEDPRDKDAVLVLAGDVSPVLTQLVGFLRTVAPRFRKVIYIPGNHEYYRSDYDDWNRRFLEAATGLHGVHVAVDQMGVMDEDGVRFVFGTMWGDGGDTQAEAVAVGDYLADFKVIGFSGRRFSVADMQGLHQRQRHQLAKALQTAKGPAVVVTHHMPSYALSHPRFGDIATGGFAGKCDDLMRGPKAPVLWIHGHTHDTIDRIVGDTRVICNPAGYQPEWKSDYNSFFAKPLFVEVAAASLGEQGAD